MAERQAVIGLCPTTEADLGDGIFPLGRASGGRRAVRHRLGQQYRAPTPRPSCACSNTASAWPTCAGTVAATRSSRIAAGRCGARALAGGAKAAGRPAGRLAPGFRADLVVLDPDHPSLVGRARRPACSTALLFAPGSPVRDVMVGGTWRVRDGQHAAEAAIARAYRRAMARLLA